MNEYYIELELINKQYKTGIKYRCNDADNDAFHRQPYLYEPAALLYILCNDARTEGLRADSVLSHTVMCADEHGTRWISQTVL